MKLARATVFWNSASVTQNRRLLLQLDRELMTVVTLDLRSPSLPEFIRSSTIVGAYTLRLVGRLNPRRYK
jgi:hypothetical protein